MKKYFLGICMLGLSLCLAGLAGCSLGHHHPPKNAQLEPDSFTKLSADLNQQKLSLGSSTEQIRQTYGEPASLFNSGSSAGRFEIWTYAKSSEKAKEDWGETILLYFDNQKLVSWKY